MTEGIIEEIQRKIGMGIYGDSINRLEAYILNNPPSPKAAFMLSELYCRTGNIPLCRRHLMKLAQMRDAGIYFKRIINLIGPMMISSDECYNSPPKFSSEGSHLIFASAKECTNGDGRLNTNDKSAIMMVNVKTLEEHMLVSNKYRNKMPSFSTDNQSIIFQSWRRDTNGDGIINSSDNSATYIMDIATGLEKEIIPDLYKTKYVQFMPQSSEVIFVCYKSPFDNAGIFIKDVHTMKERQIVSSKYENTFPSVSPDSERIVYSSWRKDTNKDGKIDMRDHSGIYLYNLITGTEKCLMDETYNNLYPIFTPDGMNIIFLSTRRDTNGDGVIDTLDNSGIYMMDLEGRNEKCLVDDSRYNKFLSISSDGKKVVFISRRMENENIHLQKKEDLYLNKGIYTVNIETGIIDELLSPEHFGARSPVFSPADSRVAYQAWRKGKRRGLYIYDLDGYSREEILKIIDRNTSG